ncbi:unnamed protein product [Oikopleura dioica]|uniref:Uncharacterized protein n=1 Tax=Oikopleura dioica TaxID=34765 RepID=E4XJH5_OIKDI|nr:unnamed protein product [Oikopleura dioica]
MERSGKIREEPVADWLDVDRETADLLKTFWSEYKRRPENNTPAAELDRNMLTLVTIEDLENAIKAAFALKEKSAQKNAVWLKMTLVDEMVNRLGDDIGAVIDINDLADLLIPEIGSIYQGVHSERAYKAIAEFLQVMNLQTVDHNQMLEFLTKFLRDAFQKMFEWIAYAQCTGIPGPALFMKNPEKWCMTAFCMPRERVDSVSALTEEENVWILQSIDPPRLLGLPKELKNRQQPPEWWKLKDLLDQLHLTEAQDETGTAFRLSLYRKNKGSFDKKTAQWSQLLNKIKEKCDRRKNQVWALNEYEVSTQNAVVMDNIVENMLRILDSEKAEKLTEMKSLWISFFGNPTLNMKIPTHPETPIMPRDAYSRCQLGSPGQLNSGPIFKSPEELKSTECRVGKCTMEVVDQLPLCTLHAHMIELAMDDKTRSTMVRTLAAQDRFTIAHERSQARRQISQMHPATRALFLREMILLRQTRQKVPSTTPEALARSAAMRAQSGTTKDWSAPQFEDNILLTDALAKFARNWSKLSAATKNLPDEPKLVQVSEESQGLAFFVHLTEINEGARFYSPKTVTAEVGPEAASVTDELSDGFGNTEIKLGVATEGIWEPRRRRSAHGRNWRTWRTKRTGTGRSSSSSRVKTQAITKKEKVEEVQILRKFVWSAESWSLIPVERNEAASFPQQVANNKGTWTFATRLVWENEEEQSLGPENLLSEIKNLPSPDEDELERERKRMLLLQLMTGEWEKAGKLEEFRVSRLDLELFALPAAAWEPSSSIMTEYIVTSPFPALSFNEWYANIMANPNGFIFFNNFVVTVGAALADISKANEAEITQIAKKWHQAMNKSPPQIPTTFHEKYHLSREGEHMGFQCLALEWQLVPRVHGRAP